MRNPPPEKRKKIQRDKQYREYVWEQLTGNKNSGNKRETLIKCISFEFYNKW